VKEQRESTGHKKKDEEHPDFAESYHFLPADCRKHVQQNQAKEYNEKKLIIRK